MDFKRVLLNVLSFLFVVGILVIFVVNTREQHRNYHNELQYFSTIGADSIIVIEIFNEAGDDIYITDNTEIKELYNLIVRSNYKSTDIIDYVQYKVIFHIEESDPYTIFVRREINSDMLLVRYPNISQSYTHRGYDDEELFKNLGFF